MWHAASRHTMFRFPRHRPIDLKKALSTHLDPRDMHVEGFFGRHFGSLYEHAAPKRGYRTFLTGNVLEEVRVCQT